MATPAVGTALLILPDASTSYLIVWYAAHSGYFCNLLQIQQSTKEHCQSLGDNDGYRTVFGIQGTHSHFERRDPPMQGLLCLLEPL